MRSINFREPARARAAFGLKVGMGRDTAMPYRFRMSGVSGKRCLFSLYSVTIVAIEHETPSTKNNTNCGRRPRNSGGYFLWRGRADPRFA